MACVSNADMTGKSSRELVALERTCTEHSADSNIHSCTVNSSNSGNIW
jgi:hypothetical protein